MASLDENKLHLCTYSWKKSEKPVRLSVEAQDELKYETIRNPRGS